MSSGAVDEVVEDVGHGQWVFRVSKMLRLYFLHERELLGALARGRRSRRRSSWRRLTTTNGGWEPRTS
jgi:hypothetical protein